MDTVVEKSLEKAGGLPVFRHIFIPSDTLLCLQNHRCPVFLTAPISEAEALDRLGLPVIGFSAEDAWRTPAVSAELSSIRWIGRSVRLSFRQSVWHDRARIANLHMIMKSLNAVGADVRSLVISAFGNQSLSEHLALKEHPPKHGALGFPSVIEIGVRNRFFSNHAVFPSDEVLSYVRLKPGVETPFAELYGYYIRRAISPLSERHFGLTLRELGVKFRTFRNKRIYLGVEPASLSLEEARQLGSGRSKR